MNRSMLTLSFVQDRGSELDTIAGIGHVSIRNTMRLWDPLTEKEDNTTVQLDMTADEARELSANLLKAADHCDAVSELPPANIKDAFRARNTTGPRY